MLGITDYLWRLLPGNPILRRVVETGGKRRWHLIIRCAYLGLLVGLVTLSLWTSSTSYGAASLAELAKDSATLFQSMSYVQLGLVALLAPIFTAGAITQEKDSQTYDILLATPLTNGQIVLGSLMSRLFFVFALLLSGVPVFSVTQIFGGVAIRSIVFSFLIAASTALVTGAMAMAIATFKIGTRRTIFSFYLFIVVYLVGFFLLDRVAFFQVPGRNPGSHVSWFTGLHPFLALHVIFNDRAYVPPDLATLPEAYKGWPISWYLTSPQTFYIAFMTTLSLVMVLPSIVLLRRLAQSTTTLKRIILAKLKLTRGDRTRKPRAVWSNPIAWREARTKASAARATFLRFGFIFAGMAGAVTLLILHSSDALPRQYIDAASFKSFSTQTLFVQSDDANLRSDTRVSPDVVVKLNGQALRETAAQGALHRKYEVKTFTTEPIPNSTPDARGVQQQQINAIDLADFPRLLAASDARKWLLGAVMVEFAVVLLIVTNAAASTVTREKEDGTLDLFLTTPITSRYYIWGKLRGLVSFVLPLVAVPAASVMLFVVHDVFRWVLAGDTDFQWIVLPEAVIIMPCMLIIVAAFAAILGMQMSLRCRTTVWAVMSSVLIMAGACAALGWCGYTVMTSSQRDFSPIVLGISTFSPFTLLAILVDPYSYGGRSFDPAAGSDADPVFARAVITLVSAIAVAAYAAAVWTMYKAMVKNFDMTIRRQSR